jgi:multiple sugar transport system substrate-binding protein
MINLARASRLSLLAIAVCIVMWSFGTVGGRLLHSYLALRNQPVKLTVLHWGDQAEDRIVQTLVDQFQLQHPTVQIVRINGGSGGDYDGKLRSMMAAGTPPDLFYLAPESLADLASMKLISPIDDRFAREPAEWKDDFFPILLDGFRYNTTTQKVGPGGSLYGLPKDFTTAGFYVNLDLFQAAGIPVPYKGWTWDEFEADMKKSRP